MLTYYWNWMKPVDSLTVLLSCLALVLLLLLLMLLVWLVKQLQESQNVSLNLTLSLLENQQVENQSLRNQLRSPDVNSLLGLQHATLPSSSVASNTESPDPVDLTGDFAYEDQLAKQGFSMGDVDESLQSAGWAPAVVRRDGESITAYEPS